MLHASRELWYNPPLPVCSGSIETDVHLILPQVSSCECRVVCRAVLVWCFADKEECWQIIGPLGEMCWGVWP